MRTRLDGAANRNRHWPLATLAVIGSSRRADFSVFMFFRSGGQPLPEDHHAETLGRSLFIDITAAHYKSSENRCQALTGLSLASA